MRAARKRVNWQSLHAELERRLARLGETIDSDAGRRHAMLRERARRLSVVAKGAASARLTRALRCRIGNEPYALPLDCAREVIPPSRRAIVPGAGEEVHGIINWRGEFVTTFDLAAVLGLTRAAPEGGRIVVLRIESPRLALIVDAVDGIVQFDRTSLQPAVELRARRADLFSGATRDSVLVIDPIRLIARLTGDRAAA
ncbi:MAG: chemotaxis protein CheW [Cucumibacter sp.]